MEVRGIDFVYYSTQDLKTAAAWYEDVLGLKNGQRWGELGVEWELPDGSAFALYGGPEVSGGRCGTVAFNVQNAAEAVEWLKSKGIEPNHVEETPVCRMVFFSDPEGNPVMFHEKPKK